MKSNYMTNNPNFVFLIEFNLDGSSSKHSFTSREEETNETQKF